MSDTHKHTHLHRFMRRHRGVIQGVTLALALCITVPLQRETVQEAYILRRPVVQIHSSSSASSLSHNTALIRRQERIARRAQTALIRHKAVVAQAAPVKIPTEALRPAAASSQRPVVPTGGTAVRATSSVSSSSSQFSAFPAFGRAVHPVSKVPNWGNMRSAAEWDRPYSELGEDDFVPVPAYDLSVLTTPMEQLLQNRNDPETIRILTAKLYYSTRHFSAYDVDAGEFTSDHPGIDLKLAEGTPAGAIAGGRVHAVRRDSEGLGLHLIIEHRAPDGETYYSVYGHMQSIAVATGDSLTSGQYIGTVGKTGFTTGPHIHLQIDTGEPGETSHTVYWPEGSPSRSEAALHTINPVEFLRRY